MIDARVLPLATSDVAFFMPPPNRPRRSGRRTDRGTGIARALTRAIRRDLAHAASQPVTDWIPRISHYPY